MASVSTDEDYESRDQVQQTAMICYHDETCARLTLHSKIRMFQPALRVIRRRQRSSQDNYTSTLLTIFL